VATLIPIGFARALGQKAGLSTGTLKTKQNKTKQKQNKP
jgi:hypothetical protein